MQTYGTDLSPAELGNLADLDRLSRQLEFPFESAITPRASWLLWGGAGYLIGGGSGAIVGIGLNVLLVWGALAAGRDYFGRLE